VRGKLRSMFGARRASVDGPMVKDHGKASRVTQNGTAKVTESNKGHGPADPRHGRLP
jgi:hypothetical protein